MNTWYRSIPLILAGLLLLGIFASGCTGTPEQKPVPTTAATPVSTTAVPGQTTMPGSPAPTTPTAVTTAATPSQIAGKLKVTGSTTVLPIAQAEADAYMDKNLRADIQVAGGGSSVGVQAIGEGTADIGMSSREISDAEKAKYPGLNPIDVATDAVVVIVHPQNPVSALTLDQVRGLYNGTYQGWDSVGGTLTYPVTIGRDSTSGTRVYFSEAVMKNEKYRSDMREMNSNGAVKQTVAQTPGAVGYVGLGFIDSTVKPIAIYSNGKPVTPSIATILSHQYPISRPLYMITKGQPSGLAQDYLDFILSRDGQKIVADQGFVPLA
ncbi:MAG: phosphate ABC transporter substrate-binding protein [Methanomicrobiales archaeon]|nr:phosphate ABC transporter substrate-binding protein [Methanomicrobiales archaeon]MDD1654863.1 phosphate ABC transporter substrate-binding protein [Methanomicrobiales archaeon]